MSARPAMRATSPAMPYSGSPSPSPPSPPPSRPRSAASTARASADRTPPKQTRQQSKRADDRPAPLPRFHHDLGPGVTVDLPRDVIDPAGEGRGRLGEAHQAYRLA